MSFLDVSLDKLKSTALTTAGARAAMYAAQKASPRVIQAAQNIFQGLNILDKAFGQQFEDTPLELMGGLTPKMAYNMMQDVRKANPARKNIFFIQITDPVIAEDVGIAPGVDPLYLLNLLAMDVSYSSNNIQGNKVSIGGAVMDQVHGSDPGDLSITTLDDSGGTLKRWFEGKQRQTAAKDGTFGLPADYCVSIEIVHGVASDAVDQGSLAFRSFMRMRPTAMQYELSRRDHGLSELQMTFSQFDTFYPSK